VNRLASLGRCSWNLCHSPTELRWFRLYATRIDTDDPRCLVVHRNVTDCLSGKRTPDRGTPPRPSGVDRPPESDRLLTYPVGPDESAVEALAAALDALGVDPFDRRTPLQEWIDLDALGGLYECDANFVLSTYVYEFLVTFTVDEIRVSGLSPSGDSRRDE
jgi:hypothetical protein